MLPLLCGCSPLTLAPVRRAPVLFGPHGCHVPWQLASCLCSAAVCRSRSHPCAARPLFSGPYGCAAPTHLACCLCCAAVCCSRALLCAALSSSWPPGTCDCLRQCNRHAAFALRLSATSAHHCLPRSRYPRASRPPYTHAVGVMPPPCGVQDSNVQDSGPAPASARPSPPPHTDPVARGCSILSRPVSVSATAPTYQRGFRSRGLVCRCSRVILWLHRLTLCVRVGQND